ncbi:MAG: PAS domain-containing protein [Desulfosarcinaceae bacterium]
MDTRGVIKFANTASHKLFGIPPGKLAGRSIYDLMPDEAQRADLKQYFETLAASTPAPTPKITRGRTARGDVLDLQVNWNYQRSGDGSLAGFIAVLTNITAQKPIFLTQFVEQALILAAQ